jgi:hypothetical protein
MKTDHAIYFNVYDERRVGATFILRWHHGDHAVFVEIHLIVTAGGVESRKITVETRFG